jgi:hypothetical protein
MALSVLGGILFLAAFARYSALGTFKDWERLLSPARRRVIQELEQDLALDTVLAGRAHGKAVRARESDEIDEALRLLDLAGAVIEEAVPSRLKRLQALTALCRMATALLPIPALLPSHFRLAEIATLAGAARLVHGILVGTRERFAFRISVLGLCYRLVRRAARKSTAEARKQPRSAAPWRAFDQGLSDLIALDEAHAESVRLLLLSFAEHPDPSREPQEIATAPKGSEA